VGIQIKPFLQGQQAFKIALGSQFPDMYLFLFWRLLKYFMDVSNKSPFFNAAMGNPVMTSYHIRFDSSWKRLAS
jgi:hypothetical protein